MLLLEILKWLFRGAGWRPWAQYAKTKTALKNSETSTAPISGFPPRAFKLRRSGLFFKTSQVQKSC